MRLLTASRRASSLHSPKCVEGEFCEVKSPGVHGLHYQVWAPLTNALYGPGTGDEELPRFLSGVAKGTRGVVRHRLERPQQHTNVTQATLCRVVGLGEHGGKTEHALVRPEYLCGKDFDASKQGSLRKLGEKRLSNSLRCAIQNLYQ